ncbi:class C sortase [Serinibacter arcticus]|uniref:Class C sortase n=1 Tax=Serinibacter arcticus TaxID=1655435 RepID=A0A2U1ZVG2_9MICO|nr:class C sortase [Serinibacter arcticus]PWD50968.1 class C sortase [Serinibacter arcticus]
MTSTAAPAPAPGRDVRRRRRPARAAWTWQQAVTGLVLVGGVGVLLYPTASEWFAARVHATEVSGYVDYAGSLADAERERQLADARDYNANLPAGPLRDPYILNDSGEVVDLRDGEEDYLRQLAGSPGEVMARVRIPTIDVDLPIYHGTDEATLTKGVGHLFGTGLPIGGPSTHAVLTAHSGLPSATLFTHLDRVEVGELFSVTVLGEDLYYQVDQIRMVEPNVADDLRQIAGEDHVTLVTCTPTGVNSHRLLVRGTRVDAPAAGAEPSGGSFDANASDPGFPWWAPALLGAGTGTYLLLRPRRRDADQGRA